MKSSLIAFVLTFISIGLFGQVIPFQGKLTENGVPVNGTKDIVVSITALSWTETHTGVQITDGLYSINLGSITPLPEDLFFNVASQELAITVSGVALSPITLQKPADILDRIYDITGSTRSFAFTSELVGTDPDPGLAGANPRAGLYGYANTTGFNVGVFGVGEATTGSTDFQTGILGYGQGDNDSPRYGVRGETWGTGTGYSVAVLGYNQTIPLAGGTQMGGYFRTFEGSTNGLQAGVRGRAQGVGGKNIGVWGEALDGDENWAGWFDGDVKVTGNLIFDGDISEKREYNFTQSDVPVLDIGSNPVGYHYIVDKDDAGTFRGLQMDVIGTGRKHGIRSNVTSAAGDPEVKIGILGSTNGDGSGSHYGLYGQSFALGHNNTGVVGNSGGVGDGVGSGGFDPNGSYNTGVSGFASNNLHGNTGVFGHASGATGYDNIGVVGWSDVTQVGEENKGVLGWAKGPGVNKGIMGMATDGTENWAGWFEGDVKVTGKLISDGGVESLVENLNYTMANGGDANGLSISHAIDPDVAGQTFALKVEATGDGNGSGDQIGFYSQARGNNRVYNTGMWGSAIGTGNGTGGSENYGVFGEARNNTNSNIGTWGVATGAAQKNIGVRGQASGATENWAGWFDGEVKVAGGGINLDGDFASNGNYLFMDAGAFRPVEIRNGEFLGSGAGEISLLNNSNGGTEGLSLDGWGNINASNLTLQDDSGNSINVNGNGNINISNPTGSITLWDAGDGIKMERIFDGINPQGGFVSIAGTGSITLDGTNGDINSSGGINAGGGINLDGDFASNGNYLFMDAGAFRPVEIRNGEFLGSGAGEISLLNNSNGGTEGLLMTGWGDITAAGSVTTNGINLGGDLSSTGNYLFMDAGAFRPIELRNGEFLGSGAGEISLLNNSNGGTEGLLLTGWGDITAAGTVSAGGFDTGGTLNVGGDLSSGGGYIFMDAGAFRPIELRNGQLLGSGAGEISLLNNSNGGTEGLLMTGWGDITAAGTVTATTLTQTSDRRYKKNIQTIENSLSNTIKLRGVSYYWKDSNKSKEKQIGVIAQEVEEIYPEFVHTDREGMKSVNYSQMVAVLIEAVKELNTKITNLENENTQLKASLAKSEENKQKIDNLQSQLTGILKLLENSQNDENVTTSED